MHTTRGPASSPIGRAIRRVLVGTAATATTAVMVDWGLAAGRDLSALAESTAAPADTIPDVAAVLALAAWAWLLLGAMVTVVEAMAPTRRRGLAPRLAPAGWRRLVLSAVGLGLLSAPVGVAHASPGGNSHIVAAVARPDPGSVATPAQAVRGLPLPDRPYGRLRPELAADTPRAPAPSSGSRGRVTVRPGDSLWAIAEHQLGPRADAQAIATEWRRWYAANRTRIGPDPNLIHPGMVLHAPARRAAS